MKTNMFLLACLMALLAACSPSTQITKSWTDPSWKQGGAIPFKKVLVVAILKDDASRRIAEDKIVASITRVTAIQSYNYIQPADTAQGKLDAKLKKDGVDGIILMRLTDVNKSVSYTQGTSYGGWYGYRYSTPGYYSEDKTFYVETNFYALEGNKLMWSGTTSTLNPTKLDKTMDDIITAIRTELYSKGLIK
jgi:hypothetical protein